MKLEKEKHLQKEEILLYAHDYGALLTATRLSGAILTQEEVVAKYSRMVDEGKTQDPKKFRQEWLPFLKEGGVKALVFTIPGSVDPLIYPDFQELTKDAEAAGLQLYVVVINTKKDSEELLSDQSNTEEKNDSSEKEALLSQQREQDKRKLANKGFHVTDVFVVDPPM